MRFVNIWSIETLVPPLAYPQVFAGEKAAAWVDGEKERRLIRRMYANSGIETRHSILNDFFESNPGNLFKIDDNGRPVEPGTRERNDRYIVESRKLAGEVARRAVNSSGFETSDITHVITVTCTGFSNPGADYFIVSDLGLKPSVARFALGFMGCYAAIPALRMAQAFCLAEPAAVVLVVSIELCSLHLHFDGGLDSLLANTLFADGTAAAIISSVEPGAGRAALRIESFASSMIPEGEKDMAWRIGNKGFDIALSTYVPDLISRNIREVLLPILEVNGLTLSDIGIWAIHPGGKAILDKIMKELDLKQEQLAFSRDVLRHYGNMSSATILFVLKRILDDESCAGPDRSRSLAIAFGPGLTVECASLVRSRTVS